MLLRGIAIGNGKGAAHILRVASFAFVMTLVSLLAVPQTGQAQEAAPTSRADTATPMAPLDTVPADSDASEDGTDGVLTRALPVIVFDRSRVLNESAAGQAFEAEIEAVRAQIVAENTEISDALEEEERALSVERPTLTEEAFRAKAEAFDQKVTEAREEQDRKAAEVQRRYDEGLDALEAQMNIALTSVARELRALVVLERQQVYLMSGAIDVSAEVIRRLDAQMGLLDEAETSDSENE